MGSPAEMKYLLPAIAAVVVLTGCGDPQADANKRVVEASQIMASVTPQASADARIAALEKAEKLLSSIPDDLPGTSVAVDIVAGKAVGGQSLSLIRADLATTRQALAMKECEASASEKCLELLFLENKAKLKSEGRKWEAHCNWLQYLSRRNRQAEASAAAKQADRSLVLACAPQALGRPLTELVREASESEFGTLGLVEAAHVAGDKATLAALLSDPLVVSLLGADIARYDLGVVSHDQVARKRLADRLQTVLRTPRHGDGLINQYEAAPFVELMDRLGVPRTDTESLVDGLEATWRQTLAEDSRPDKDGIHAIVADGVSLARLRAGLEQPGQREAVVSTLLDFVFAQDPAGSLTSVIRVIGGDMTDAQIDRVLTVLKRDKSGQRRGELGLILIQAERRQIGEPLLAANKAVLDQDDVALILDRPGDAALLKELAPKALDFLLADAVVNRLRQGDAKDRVPAMAELFSLARNGKDPEDIASYLGAALLALADKPPA